MVLSLVRYAAARLTTSVVEVAHHMRRETVATQQDGLARTFRVYTAKLEEDFVDICGEQAALPAIYDPTDYAASQAFGEEMRKDGEFGILFDSLRHEGGINAVAFSPSRIAEVTQGDHYQITVERASSRIQAKNLEHDSEKWEPVFG